MHTQRRLFIHAAHAAFNRHLYSYTIDSHLYILSCDYRLFIHGAHGALNQFHNEYYIIIEYIIIITVARAIATNVGFLSCVAGMDATEISRNKEKAL